MNEEYLSRARAKVRDVRLFINGVSKRASQLSKGNRRLVPTLPDDDRSNLDIALLEVAEGKVIIKAEDEK
ncbi:MAG: DNA-directed RNA polymerase subunit omega [Lentisphaeria bacterium]|jgi:DNA-directed RNA polymerase subunit K/omega|nr:DNA-directed RNA polymerase subunit omega [Lentisphaeria bacterium]MDY0175978.1 DNA-directed RNA polymerase subunit omega [Lentisphaeria bacterium]NLZ60245.1 DNA-directed RNA polymerase subunit omega [Lentisphaerota bacterium]